MGFPSMWYTSTKRGSKRETIFRGFNLSKASAVDVFGAGCGSCKRKTKPIMNFNFLSTLKGRNGKARHTYDDGRCLMDLRGIER